VSVRAAWSTGRPEGREEKDPAGADDRGFGRGTKLPHAGPPADPASARPST
jgi:hypothetical protein